MDAKKKKKKNLGWHNKISIGFEIGVSTHKPRISSWKLEQSKMGFSCESWQKLKFLQILKQSGPGSSNLWQVRPTLVFFEPRAHLSAGLGIFGYWPWAHTPFGFAAGLAKNEFQSIKSQR